MPHTEPAYVAHTEPTYLPTPDHYVAKTGNDTTGNGSVGTPWLTIQKAADTISAGEVVSVGAGTYDERVTIASGKSGSSSNHTEFWANGAVVVGQGFDIQSDYTDLVGFAVTPATSEAIYDYDWQGVVYVQGSYVTLTNLNIHDCSRASAICLHSTESNITIDGCTIDNVKYDCISTDNGGSGAHASYVTVRDCIMKNWGGAAAIILYGDYWTIEDCEIQGVAAGFTEGTDGDGIEVNFSAHSVIRRCRIYDIWPYYGWAAGAHVDCIQFWLSVTDLLVDSCVLGSWKTGGPDLAPGPTNAIMYGTCETDCDVTVQNCVFLVGIAAGPTAVANSHNGASGVNSGYTLTTRLYNNTFFGNFPDLQSSGGGTGVQILKNNVFYAHKATNFVSGGTHDHNAFLWMPWSDYGVTGLQASALPTDEGAGSLGTSYETRLVAADIFLSPEVDVGHDYGLRADFSPTTGSVLIGAGDPAYAPAYDITGKARSDPPSIGAYE